MTQDDELRAAYKKAISTSRLIGEAKGMLSSILIYVEEGEDIAKVVNNMGIKKWIDEVDSLYNIPKKLDK